MEEDDGRYDQFEHTWPALPHLEEQLPQTTFAKRAGDRTDRFAPK